MAGGEHQRSGSAAATAVLGGASPGPHAPHEQQRRTNDHPGPSRAACGRRTPRRPCCAAVPHALQAGACPGVRRRAQDGSSSGEVGSGLVSGGGGCTQRRVRPGTPHAPPQHPTKRHATTRPVSRAPPARPWSAWPAAPLTPPHWKSAWRGSSCFRSCGTTFTLRRALSCLVVGFLFACLPGFRGGAAGRRGSRLAGRGGGWRAGGTAGPCLVLGVSPPTRPPPLLGHSSRVRRPPSILRWTSTSSTPRQTGTLPRQRPRCFAAWSSRRRHTPW